MRKYELTEETQKAAFEENVTLHRIKALVDIPEHNVKSGDLGGWVENEGNLSHDGKAWVGGNAFVFQHAVVSEDALVTNRASVKGCAVIRGTSLVSGHASVRDNALVTGDAVVTGDVSVYGIAEISEQAKIDGSCRISAGHVYGEARVSDSAIVCCRHAGDLAEGIVPHICDKAKVRGTARVSGGAKIYGQACVEGSARVSGTACVGVLGDATSTKSAHTPHITCGEITDGVVVRATDILMYGPVDTNASFITFNRNSRSFTGFGVTEKYGRFRSRLQKRWGGDEQKRTVVQNLAMSFVETMGA